MQAHTHTHTHTQCIRVEKKYIAFKKFQISENLDHVHSYKKPRRKSKWPVISEFRVLELQRRSVPIKH